MNTLTQNDLAVSATAAEKLAELIGNVEEDVEGIGGAHCYEMFAGAAVFEKLMADEPGSFFLTDYLAGDV